jgi:L-2,4-diaminobutyric acid acetyltransferase
MPSKIEIPTVENRPALPQLREPQSGDGAAVWQLIRDCAPLDRNSLYCNLLQCDHFASTCVVAELDGDVVGWISGYIVPDQPDTLFVWQVAVSEKARGLGLARKMIDHILDREVCGEVEKINTTITRDNKASWALFRSVAERREAPFERAPHYTREHHFEGRHDTEYLVTIGPFGAAAGKKAAA